MPQRSSLDRRLTPARATRTLLLLGSLAVAIASCILPAYHYGEVEVCGGKPKGTPCSVGPLTGTCQADACDIACTPAKKGADCDDAEPCTVDTCDPGTKLCQWEALDNTQPPGVMPIPGDCKQQICDMGKSRVFNSETDLPPPVDCMTTSCKGGAVIKTQLPSGTACGVGKMLECDAKGQCSGCTADDQCAGDTCNAPKCTDGKCTTTPKGAGTPLPDAMQAPHDCQVLICDDKGAIISTPDVNDVPTDDAEVCTVEACVQGSPQHLPATSGSCPTGSCSDGKCVQCVVPGQCPPGGQCTHPDCVSFVCGIVNDLPGQACNIGGKVCDGNGACVECTAPADCAPPGLCQTTASCSQNQCSYGFAPAGTPCGAMQQCDGLGACKLLNGQPCMGNTECSSTHCADGVCCDTSCLFLCRGCKGAWTVAGVDGQCSNIKTNTDPSDECPGAPVCLLNAMNQMVCSP